jgi:hypothetical protein
MRDPQNAEYESVLQLALTHTNILIVTYSYVVLLKHVHPTQAPIHAI